MSTSFRSAALASLLALASGCSEDEHEHEHIGQCAAATGLHVTVYGAGNPDGAIIGVRATDGEYEEDLDCASDGFSLVCTGANERPGSYLLEVVIADEVYVMSEATVSDGECSAVTL